MVETINRFELFDQKYSETVLFDAIQYKQNITIQTELILSW